MSLFDKLAEVFIQHLTTEKTMEENTFKVNGLLDGVKAPVIPKTYFSQKNRLSPEELSWDRHNQNDATQMLYTNPARHGAIAITILSPFSTTTR